MLSYKNYKLLKESMGNRILGVSSTPVIFAGSNYQLNYDEDELLEAKKKKKRMLLDDEDDSSDVVCDDDDDMDDDEDVESEDESDEDDDMDDDELDDSNKDDDEEEEDDDDDEEDEKPVKKMMKKDNDKKCHCGSGTKNMSKDSDEEEDDDDEFKKSAKKQMKGNKRKIKEDAIFSPSNPNNNIISDVPEPVTIEKLEKNYDHEYQVLVSLDDYFENHDLMEAKEDMDLNPKLRKMIMSCIKKGMSFKECKKYCKDKGQEITKHHFKLCKGE